MRMEKILLVILIAIVLVIPMYLVGTATRTQSVQARGSVLMDASITNRKDGQKMWAIHTEQTAMSPDMSSAELKGVTVEIVKESATVRADSGKYDFQNSGLALSGNVEARARDLVMSGQDVSIKSDTGEVYSAGDVKVITKGLTLTGKGFALLGNNFKVVENVRAQIR